MVENRMVARMRAWAAPAPGLGARRSRKGRGCSRRDKHTARLPCPGPAPARVNLPVMDIALKGRSRSPRHCRACPGGGAEGGDFRGMRPRRGMMSLSGPADNVDRTRGRCGPRSSTSSVVRVLRLC